jgi:hypothetical protein
MGVPINPADFNDENMDLHTKTTLAVWVNVDMGCEHW